MAKAVRWGRTNATSPPDHRGTAERTQLEAVDEGSNEASPPYFDTGLAANSTHSYQVSAIDAAGNESARTTAISKTTTDGAWSDSTAPTAPTGTTAAATAGGISVSWTAASDGSGSGITRYIVYRNSVPLIYVAGTSTTFTDRSAVAGTQYSYAVAAVDAAGNVSLPSNTATATVPPPAAPADTTAPSVPTSVTAGGGIGRVTLGWNASTDNVAVAGYNVYRDGTLLGTTASLLYVDAMSGVGVSHTYTVAAIDSSGNASAASAPATASASGVAVSTTTYAYDITDKLLSITAPSGQVTSFSLDVLGRHASRTVGTSPTETYAYLGTSNTVISITSGSTVTTSAIDGQGERVASSVGGATAWVVNDLHGNVVAALATDGSAVTAAYRYDAYGQTVAAYSAAGASLAWRYQGRILESAPGTADLYDFTARSYSPGLGAFTQNDTYNGSAANTGLLNHYMYTGGNPVTMSDPTGHCGHKGDNLWDNTVGCVTDGIGAVGGALVDAGRTVVKTGVDAGKNAWNFGVSTVTAVAGTVGGAVQSVGAAVVSFSQTVVTSLNRAWVSSIADFRNFAASTSAWATDVRASINSTMQSLRSMGANLDFGNIGAMAMAMVSDPHAFLAMASMFPGLGGVFAAADVALYLCEGDFQNAALAGLGLLPGGALLAVAGAAVIGIKGAKVIGKSVGLMASAGARGLGALTHGAGKVLGGIAHAAGSKVKAILSTVGSKIQAAGARVRSWAGRGESAVDAEADAWRVGGTATHTGRTVGKTVSTSTIDEVVASSARKIGNRYQTEGERALLKKAGHADSGRYQSAFGGMASQTHAERIIRDALSFGDMDIKSSFVDAYNRFGQGVRFNPTNGAFIGFLEGTLR